MGRKLQTMSNVKASKHGAAPDSKIGHTHAEAVRWQVTKRDQAKTVLGEVTARLWMEARAEAMVKWHLDQSELDVTEIK